MLTSPPILNLDALSLSSPDGRSLLRSASASFHPGITALSGPNGSGKSTLLRAIAMLHPIDSGVISLGLVKRTRRAFLSQMVFMPQNFPVYPTMTGQEFLEYSLLLRGSSRSAAKSIAASWLHTVGLEPVARALSGAYSQGMRQRLGFAYALQLDVPLYLLDEPFSGVDAEWRERMLDLLVELSQDRIAIVITHHAEALLSRGANSVQLLNQHIEQAQMAAC